MRRTPRTCLEELALPESSLRAEYLNATLDQRYHVAMQRVNNAGLVTNEVVIAIIALEALARAIVVDVESSRGMNRDKAYCKYWRRDPVQLLKVICAQYGVESGWFLPEDLQALPRVLAYRNLLAHEATSLNGATCQGLIDTTRRLIKRAFDLAKTMKPLDVATS